MSRAKAAFVKRTVIAAALFAFVTQHLLCCYCLSKLFADWHSHRLAQEHAYEESGFTAHACHRSCGHDHDNLPSPDSNSHRHHSCLGTHLYAAPETSGLGQAAAKVSLLPADLWIVAAHGNGIAFNSETASWRDAWHHSATPTLPLRAQLQVYLF